MLFLVKQNFWNKRRIGTAALIRKRHLLTFFVLNAALNRVNTVHAAVRTTQENPERRRWGGQWEMNINYNRY